MPLSPSELLTLFGMIATAVAAFVGVREQGKGMKVTLDESLRQIQAVHKRLDGYAQRIERAEVNHAVLLERVENIRDTQRLRRAALLEANAKSESPMFADSEAP